MRKYLNIVTLLFVLFTGIALIPSDGFLRHFLLGQMGTVAPFSPYGLTTKIINYNQIQVSWIDDSANASTSRDTKEFKLYRRSAYTGSWSLIFTTSGVSYTDINLIPGSYEYKVSACNDGGCSADSSVNIATFQKDTILPSQPGSFSVPQKEVTDTKANLYWSKSTDDIGIKHYNIYRSPASANNFSFIASVSASQLSYSDTSLSPITNYYYYIEAVDLAKNKSLATSFLDITTLPIGGSAGFVRVVSPNGGECFVLPGNLHIVWTGSNVNQAEVYYGTKLIYVGGGTVYDWYMTASVSPTIAGTVKVTAIDNNGNKGLSDTNDKPFTISLNCSQETPVPALVPAVPTYFRASLVAGRPDIKLDWQDNSKDEIEFRVYRRILPDGSWKYLGSAGPNGTSYIDVNVPPSDYEYDVNACNSVGCSAYSNQFKITAISTLPSETVKTFEISELKSGDMISATGSNDPDVYIINEHGYKRLFLNEAIFGFYSHLGGFQNIKRVEEFSRDNYKTSGLFRDCEVNDGKVYGVEITGEDTASLHWVNTTGEQAVSDDPDFFKKVFCINSSEFNWYQKGSDYTSVSQIPDYSR